LELWFGKLYKRLGGISLDTLNTIKGYHIKIVDGVYRIGKKEYCWHIPKYIRNQGIKKGDLVLVKAKGKKVPIIVFDVFRENFEDTDKRYERVLTKLKNRE
jgi:CRISPR/Cas system CSM-associated protein Csm4 (group 5 of RAMP superfamily)